MKTQQISIFTEYSISSDTRAPSRIFDLSARGFKVDQLKFSWTAPGNKYDEGIPNFYSLYQTRDPNILYNSEDLNSAFLYSLPSTLPAGEKEILVLNVTSFNEQLYFAIRAVDKVSNHATCLILKKLL